MSIAAAPVPLSFFEQFTGVEVVKSNDAITDSVHFLGFLKSLTSLRNLELVRSQLSHAFYDQLPKFAPMLHTFKLIGGEPGLEFNFLRVFSRLYTVRIDRNLSFKQFSCCFAR